MPSPHLLSHLLPFVRHAVLPALLPSSCALCDRSGPRALCDGCDAQFFRAGSPRCGCCAATLPGTAAPGARCGRCLTHPPAYDATVAAADYAPPLDQLVLGLKFGGRLALAPLLAARLHAAAQAAPALRNAQPDLMTAVPLGSQRLVERGFNQALEIARPLARRLGVPLAPRLLARQRETRPQSLLHPDERHRNIRQAFLVPADAGAPLAGRHVGVVDDVLTTGETLQEVAATLKRFGAARVTAFVFARTP